jgi:simple sugar transport system permease protein
MIFTAMVLSGALAGLVGLPELLGDKHAYTDTFSVGLGFDGIAVALLGRKHPLGMALAAVVWGFLDAAGRFLDLEGIPREIVTIMQGVIVLSVVIVYQVTEQISQRRVAASTAATLERTEPVAA